jgi:probable phosphoglycerate mutase
LSPSAATRHLYLARHAEPRPGGGSLTGRGYRQAELLGRRLAGVPLDSVSHGPLPRAVETARVVADQLCPEVPVHEVEAAGDYVPCLPTRDDLAPWGGDPMPAPLAAVTDDEASSGAQLAAEAIRRFTGPTDAAGEQHELVVTHAFTVGWLVRDALGAPGWRWWGLDHCHAALTVIRYAPDRPPTVMVFNDMAHLPDELRWTGFPPELRL